jgi:hypothetical protein
MLVNKITKNIYIVLDVMEFGQDSADRGVAKMQVAGRGNLERQSITSNRLPATSDQRLKTATALNLLRKKRSH